MNTEIPEHRSELPVWLYIGILLLIYAVMLLSAGVYQLSHPPRTVLAQYHATLWAGVVLLILGATYVLVFWPGRRR